MGVEGATQVKKRLKTWKKWDQNHKIHVNSRNEVTEALQRAKMVYKRKIHVQ